MRRDTYQYTEGYADVPPGITQHHDVVIVDDDGSVTMLGGKKSRRFNEIHIDGPTSPRELISQEEGVTLNDDVLFLDDPDYAAKRIRRTFIVSKDIPLTQDDDFVRRWHALSTGDAGIIQSGTGSGNYHPYGGNWGGINTLSAKRGMLPYIQNMDDATKAELENSASSAAFATKFVAWYITIDAPYRLIYQDV